MCHITQRVMFYIWSRTGSQRQCVCCVASWRSGRERVMSDTWYVAEYSLFYRALLQKRPMILSIHVQWRVMSNTFMCSHESGRTRGMSHIWHGTYHTCMTRIESCLTPQRQCVCCVASWRRRRVWVKLGGARGKAASGSCEVCLLGQVDVLKSPIAAQFTGQDDRGADFSEFMLRDVPFWDVWTLSKVAL